MGFTITLDHLGIPLQAVASEVGKEVRLLRSLLTPDQATIAEGFQEAALLKERKPIHPFEGESASRIVEKAYCVFVYSWRAEKRRFWGIKHSHGI